MPIMIEVTRSGFSSTGASGLSRCRQSRKTIQKTVSPTRSSHIRAILILETGVFVCCIILGSCAVYARYTLWQASKVWSSLNSSRVLRCRINVAAKNFVVRPFCGDSAGRNRASCAISVQSSLRSKTREKLASMGFERVEQAGAPVFGESHRFDHPARGGTLRRVHGSELLGCLRFVGQEANRTLEKRLASCIVRREVVPPFHGCLGL